MPFTPLMVFTLFTAFTLVPTGCERVDTVIDVNTPSDTEAPATSMTVKCGEL